MASLIHELENNEAILLMFLSGELSPEDQLEVQQLLAGDAGMRAEFARLKSEYDGAMGMLTRLDADRSALPAENHAIRQAMRAMKQWQVDRLARQPVIIPPPRMKIPVWVYPLASMAALVIGSIAWWGFGGQIHVSTSTSGSDGSDTTAMVSRASPDQSTSTAESSDPLNLDVASSDSSTIIAKAETQASTIAARSDSAAVTSGIFLTEANP